jgi:hypothetical protein
LFKKFLAPIPEDELKMVTEKAFLIIESFNLMGYDAMGIGDDDLSLGKEFLLEITKKANFPLLSSNILDEESGKPLFQPYIIKKVNGMRIGIFSLLSPDNFLSHSDPRRKGLSFHPPIESAQNMVKELQSKTDLIILLSHLGYPRDVQLAQTVSGIHLIMGSHTGINLVYPTAFRNTLIFQMAPRGMNIGRVDVTLQNYESNFFNSIDKRSLENGLSNLKERITFAQLSEIEGWIQHYSPIYSRIYNILRFYNLPISGDLIQTLRDLLTFLKTQEVEKSKSIRVKAKGEIEQFLKLLHGKNEFTHNLFLLSEQIKDHPEIRKIIEAFRTKFPEIEKAVSPKYEAPRPQDVTPPK